MGIFQKLKRRMSSLVEDSYYPQLRHRRESYSQCGEDLILEFLFSNKLKIRQPTYLDIGAHHPFKISNTYYFYRNGSQGINVEANPELLDLFLKHRPRDKNLNMGAAGAPGEMTFFSMTEPSMSTFSQEEAERIDSTTDMKISNRTRMKVCTINQIVKDYCDGRFPDLLSIDVEGLELEIIRNIDFEKNFPKVICIETIIYEEQKKQLKKTDVIDFLISKNYVIYADTFINTIFVRDELLT